MKNKWYRSTITKTILIALEHVFAAVIIASVLSVLAYPAFAQEMWEGRVSDTYENSLVFEEAMKKYSTQAITGLSTAEIFETDGEYDPDRLIDIEEFWNNNTVSGKNTSGLAYRLEDLLDWYTGYTEYDSKEDTIIVCEKEDKTYHYYRYGEFASLIANNELKLNGYMESNGEIIDYLNEMGDTGNNFLQVQDKEGKTLYVSCWCYDAEYFAEPYKPDGAEDLLDIVNNDERWNGRLSAAYDMISSTISMLQEESYYYWSTNENLEEGDTNFCYIYVDKKAKKVYSNYKGYSDYKNLDANLQQLKTMGRYVVVEPTLKGFESNIQDADAEGWRSTVKNHRRSGDEFIFVAAVDTKYPVQDKFYTDWENYETYGEGIRALLVGGIVSVLLFIVGLVWLTIIAGRRSEDEEIHLARFDRWKTELAAGFTIGLTLLPAILGIVFISDSGMFNMLYYFEEGGSYGLCTMYIVAATAIEVVAFAFFLIGYLSLVRRIKARTLWKDSLLRKLVLFVKYIFAHIHGIWKTLLTFGAFIIVHWFSVGLALAYYYGGSSGIFIVIMIIVEIVAAAYLVIYAIGREKIKTGIQNIAAGDVEYKIPTEKMLPEHKEIAEKVNSIGEGLDAAVEKSMKSERLKTDLITNVSHDIKTPLTSIINYVDLLKKEKFEDPKVQRYLEILDQKSQRLKTLTEDVVEASKVSSGNISLEYMQINFVEMIQQTSGEFEEKFTKRGLKEILVLPEKEVVIRVDGRRTWRVLENIYNNAAKYAMEGSRVYADLKVVGNQAVFTLKNISEQPLNISADELTERFIRGDISRSTEGSGLGLSIARSLTEMQGGRFEIYLDGDLFKVTIKFPVV